MPTYSWPTSSPRRPPGHVPLSGRIVPEFQPEDLREIIHGNYRLVYRVHVDAIAILTVFHAARLLPGDIEQRRG